jgi:membrane-bound metal-dependent hydrolase YbcI (DUF457 family)
MKLPEHVALSYLVAQLGVQQQYGLAGTVLVITAGVLPDLDGLTVLGGWGCHRKYHRMLGHGLPVTLAGPPLLAVTGAAVLGASVFWPLWAWLQLSLLVHLLSDCLFYRWPVQLAWPLSARGVGLGLVGWNDLVPTLLLYGGAVGCLVWPASAFAIAAASLAALSLYVAWRAVRPPARSGWPAWLAGRWAYSSPRLLLWLTGDFVT